MAQGLAQDITLRPGSLDDTAAIVALNAAVVAVTSPMDDAGFSALFALAAVCDVAERDGAVIGFIIAMDHGATYANGNFCWFADRLKRFTYIDRAVIGDQARSLGLGSLMYDRLGDAARRRGSLVLAAEMDLVPANTGSLRFHARRGFVELGTRALDSGKIVSMQVASL